MSSRWSITHEPYVPAMPVVEHPRYSLDVFDDRDNLIDVLGRVAGLAVGHAAFEAAVAKHPETRIYRSMRVPIEGARGSGRGLTAISQGCRRVMQA